MSITFGTFAASDDPTQTTKAATFDPQWREPADHRDEPRPHPRTRPMDLEKAVKKQVFAGIRDEHQIIRNAMDAAGVPDAPLANPRVTLRKEARAAILADSEARLAEMDTQAMILWLALAALMAILGGLLVDSASTNFAFSRVEGEPWVRFFLGFGAVLGMVLCFHRAMGRELSFRQRVPWLALCGLSVVGLALIRSGYSSPWAGVHALQISAPDPELLGGPWDWMSSAFVLGLASMGSVLCATAGIAGLLKQGEQLRARQVLERKLDNLKRDQDVDLRQEREDLALRAPLAEEYKQARGLAVIAFHEAMAEVAAFEAEVG